MNIAVIGAGYVGLVTGVSFANLGNDVVCVESDREKLALLRKAVPPFYELGLAELLKKNIDAGRLRFSDTVSDGIRNAEAIFIAVGTPSLPDGSADLSAVWSVAEEIAAHLDHKALIVTKSTVPPGTT
ncbi:UDP-glucose/GDP-mannose dehydrogenase family protein, partial [bacterium]|nr:UDP-glucose/GDP-mannose dehydrogenase family protein [bacterium]